ncbi:MAG TPA: TRAP transporter substrate-binding protein [Smithellaceae bacterium]|jgi:TRAP-type transport system periplasmic protein|nr:TRAP transporter substrate-binding protein [Smithella sp.]HOG81735.1 TRAP transporter substrate-binding protein [Smithellaceae bacterium]HOQ41952.1 TRAP transporter substrate-binding protein [Smithellaceae bacterium]HPL66611.1 TRAP transporter substrate-binding protein [Smithellaceae bacterium]
MKKRSFFVRVSLFTALFVTFLFGSSVMAQTTLTYSIFFPATHAQAKAGESWAKEIEKRTGGKVKINIFAGGSLTPADQCFDGVEKGISDIGMSCFAYTRGRLPLLEALDLPMGYPNGMVATLVANDFVKKMQPKELDGVKVLYLHAHGPGLLHTQKPVNSLANMKGMKIRSTGLSAKIVENLGGVSVAMPQGGTYEALQKGVVQGTLAPMETLKGWKQAQVVKYTTDCTNIGYTTAMFVVMNKKKWNSLPKDIQKAFDDVSQEWIAVAGKAWDDADVEGYKYSAELGNKVIKLPAAEEAKWEAAIKPVTEKYIKNAESKGLPGKQAVAEVKALIKKHSKVKK